MKIDIEPIIEKANDYWRICIDMRQIDCLYVFRLANGENYSIEFERKALDEFLPNKTVSQVVADWEEGLDRQYKTYLTAYETKIHPTWTSHEKVMHDIIPNYWTGKYKEVPYVMNNSEARGFLGLAERTKAKLGKISFVKIC